MGTAKGANGSNHNSMNQSPLGHSQGLTSSNHSIQSQPSSRSSDSTTQGVAHSTPPPANGGAPGAGGGGGGHGGEVTATANIMNSVADASSSLFQICVTLRQRLLGVPGFGESMIEVEEEADEDTDPVTLLWRTFRRGTPLMMLYNALRPSQPLKLGPGVRDDKRGKASTFKFLQACVNDLKFPQEECFIIMDLYGDDTTGFVKVARVVNRLLDLLVQRGLIEDRRPTATDFEQAAKGLKKSQRQYIVSELVTTERTYVQHLELLQAFKHLVEEKGVIPGDCVHDIFLNLNSLLDFQRRFLIRVEQTNALPEEEQNWGKLFVLYCEAFKVYEPYIANQRKCERTVMAEFSKLKDAGGSLEMRQIVENSAALYGFLMKPMQRLSKYPLLLDDLYKKGDLDEERRADLLMGKEASTSSLTRANQAVDREEKAEAVQELKVRVEDWKGHRVEGFGALLLYGTFTVLKSENLASGKDGERQYHVYLFETILLCCKDIDLSKPKNKLSSKQLVDKRGKPKLQLKGRIFMQNVTDLVSLAKPGMADHILSTRSSERIFWKGDPSIENFIIRFASEDAMKKWAQQIEAQRRRYRDSRQARNSAGSQRTAGVSVTEFSYMANQPALENPYAKEHGEDEEEDDDGTETLVNANGQLNWAGPGGYPTKSDFAQSRNGSSTSLRSRSTTADSGGGVQSAPPPTQQLTSAASARAPAPRLPMGSLSGMVPPLSLRTQQLQQAAASPGERGGMDSYFSPTVESPMSSRTSSSSTGTYPFPRQPIPGGQNGGGYYEDGHGGSRFTAPALGRPVMGQREASLSGGGGGGPSNGYAPPGRQPSGGALTPRPSFPAGGGGMHSAQQLPMPPRNRSASSPDIHGNHPGGVPVPGRVSGTALRNGAGQQQQQPPVPDVPGMYQQNPHMAPRSQSNSPANGAGNGGPPGRAGTASPAALSQLHRERSYQARQGPQDPSPTSGSGGGGVGGGYGLGGYEGGRPDPRGMQYPSSRTVTPVPGARGAGGAFSPPPQSGTPGSVAGGHSHSHSHSQSQSQPQSQSQSQQAAILAEIAGPPTQLKVKVHCPSASQVLTLVVPLNITYQSLKDRIDAKLQRSTNLSLSERAGVAKEQQVKLKYLDEEDYVSIQSDEDVLTAFETWREQRGGGEGGVGGVGMGEIELFCQR
ncbi:hypothetical protein LTR36_006006 [Oleoguttula mirabilis]|uniref:DH domain-containing protein n=1 Tax=Oleoguttula mirabilis TaxID=1507867 RepID=A0AAV9JD29_9PEZI|nr:hypothetical protein LTR36_006006 [Oleoguttula mirabilis]